MLLQGDPQVITKQRVETAIRVIIDLLRHIPPTTLTPPLPDHLVPLVLRDQRGNPVSTLERISTFRSIRLQAGTTTKASSKKQLQAGPTPNEQLLFLETAVYMSDEGGKRVYACKRCRMREAKRRQSKDASRKKPQSSEDAPIVKDVKPDITSRPPSATYITGSNPEQYDPHKQGQEVEEPPWNPSVPDWRHEIVLFNSAPEVPMKDGSCSWLPFRVVCYGKCHGEKHGFRVKFTLRTYTGAVIATSITSPIRITDDHKTDAKTKPRIDGMTSTNPAIPRSRKSRPSTSVASSRQISPAPSDVSSVQSVSEVGAVYQKQTPHVRAGKPYDRPPSHSPLVGTLPMDTFFNNMETSQYRRTPSSASLHSMAGLTSQNDIMSQGFIDGTVSPGILRPPTFDINAHRSNNPSAIQSGASSQVTSPMTSTRPLDGGDMLYDGSIFNSLNALAQQQQESRQIGYPGDAAGLELSNAMVSGLDGLFDSSSQASFASSFSDGASLFSNSINDGSIYSDSGVVPDDMQMFMDYTGGEGESSHPVNHPSFFDNMSPVVPRHPLSPASTTSNEVGDILQQLLSQPRSSLSPPTFSPPRSSPHASVSPIQNFQPMPPVPPPQPAPNPPIIASVIPAEGPVGGGTVVAIIGANFTPDTVVMFGDRTGKLIKADPSVIQIIAPPAASPGYVEVTIANVIKPPGLHSNYYKYKSMDTDLMILALEVKNRHNGSLSDPAYRLASRLTESGGGWSSGEMSSSSPGSGPSPQEADVVDDPLETKIMGVLEDLDETAPGSLRRSGCVNVQNESKQTLLHIATAMGFTRLVRRLVHVGAHLDVQDLNGYTALSIASLMGRLACAKVLMEAGAAYDRPTAFGELPLDLAKAAEHAALEALLLSSVWSTTSDQPSARPTTASISAASLEASSEIDEDNPSDGSDEEEEEVYGMVKPRRRVSRMTRGKRPASSVPVAPTAPRSRRQSLSIAAAIPLPPDDPPPYDTIVAPNNTPRTYLPDLSTIKFPVPDAVWDRLPSPIHNLIGDKHTDNGWVAFPAPTWETISKMASPEEVKLFTQAMAAAAFNAVVQSGATTATISQTGGVSKRSRTIVKSARTSRSSGSSGSGSGSPRKQITEQVKSELFYMSWFWILMAGDRMLYLFWLPILLFVGFWLLVTALPIATGFCLIYARQITRAIKQRI